MPSVAPCNDAVGFDCSAKISMASGKHLSAMGFKFAVRYVGLSQPNASDIDPDEMAIILGEVGALWLVQHPLNAGWSPSGQLGQAHGTSAARNAKAAGYLSAAVLWQDLEGVSEASSMQSVIDYTNEWGNAVTAAGFLHGLYVGFDAILTPSQLYRSLPTVRTYWSDFGSRAVEVRGFAMKQYTNSISLPDVPFAVDLDICGPDMLGARPTWMIA
jgi:glycoside hydrolase-like protein